MKTFSRHGQSVQSTFAVSVPRSLFEHGPTSDILSATERKLLTVYIWGTRVFVSLGKKNCTSVSVVRNRSTTHAATLHDDPDQTGSARTRCGTIANAVFFRTFLSYHLIFRPFTHAHTYVHAYGLPAITTSSKQRRSSAPSCTR